MTMAEFLGDLGIFLIMVGIAILLVRIGGLFK